MASNDVPEYLNELIPYRCPKCGHLRRFATLRELRQHLQSEHSFQMGFVKPNARSHVFKASSDSSGCSNTTPSQSSDEKLFRTSNKYDTDAVNALRKSNNTFCANGHIREISPLLKSFKEETELLEKELQLARRNEINHKALSMHNLTESSINTDFKMSLEAVQNCDEQMFKQEMNHEAARSELDIIDRKIAHRNAVEKTCIRNEPTLTIGLFGNKHDSKTTHNSVNAEVIKSRMNHWVTSDALYKSQDLLREMEVAAENKCQEQRGIIQQLVQEKKTNDTQLESSTKQHAELSSERQRLLQETESLVRETDDYNTKLRQELNGRGRVLEGLNKELEKLRTMSEQELKSKDEDLENATHRIGQLEWERDRLIHETDRILKQADMDSGLLRQTLQAKEEELQDVNETLSQLRLQQQSMLEKTMTVYRSSEESREIMKTAIQTKDGQLHHAMKRIENMSTLHKRLEEHSRILTDQADDNTASMKRLLQAKAGHMEDIVQQLQTLKAEKCFLEDSTSSLAEKAESSISAVESLRGMVRQKEDDLKITQSELHDLKSFLRSAADKERAARQKLETFIEDLINRAEKAESELRILKSHSTGSSSAHSDIRQDISIEMQQEEISERKSLPASIGPIRSMGMSSIQRDISIPMKRNKLYNPVNDVSVQEIQDNIARSATTAEVYEPKHNVNMNIGESEAYLTEHSIMKTSFKNKSCTDEAKIILLEESGGFIAMPECKSNERSDDLYGQKYKNHLNVEERHANGGGAPYHWDNASSNTYEGNSKHNSQLSNNIQDLLRRSNDTNDQHTEPTTKHDTREDSELDECVEYYREHYAGETQSQIGDDTQSMSDSEHYNTRRDRTKKSNGKRISRISRGLQVGTFFSASEINQESSDDSLAGSDNNLNAKCKTKNRKQKDILSDNSHTRTCKKRPATMGKSHQSETVTKRTHRNMSNRRKCVLNHVVNTKFPAAHRSMTDISLDRVELSEGEVLVPARDGKRQSKSLSPRRINTRSHYRPSAAAGSSTDTSPGDDIQNKTDDIDIADHNVSEQTDGAFKNIMDENGILWEDDMATLPDVSDSEFDRVSPSGSEAIATKNTCNTTTTAVSNQPTSPTTSNFNRLPIAQSSKTLISNNISPDTDDELSIPKGTHLLSDKPKESQILRDIYVGSPHNARNETYKSPHHELNDDFKRNEQPRKCANLSVQDQHRTKMTVLQFRPIHSPLGNKSSISDKDMTSGGQEVNKIMRLSPNIDILGTSVSGTPNVDSIASKLSTTERASVRMTGISPIRSKYTGAAKSNVVSSKYALETDISRRTSNLSPEKDIISETVEERIQYISNKYSPKHSSRIPLAEHGLSMNIEQQVSSIKEKYKRRREDILQGKGVTQIYGDVSEDSRASKRNTPSNNSTYRRLSETDRHAQTIPRNKLSFDRIKQSVLPLPYGTFENGQPHSVYAGSSSNSRHGVYHLPQQYSGYSGSSTDSRHDEHHLSQYPYMQYAMPFPYPPNYPFPPYTFQSGYQAQERSQPNDPTETNLTSLEYNTRTADINKSSPNVSTHLSDTESKTDADKGNGVSQDCIYKMKELERGHDISLKNISDVSDKHIDVPTQEHKPSILMKEYVIETDHLPEIQSTCAINMDTTIRHTTVGDVELGSEKYVGTTRMSSKIPGSSNMSDKWSPPIADKSPEPAKLPDKNSRPTAGKNPGSTSIPDKSSVQTADKSSVQTASKTPVTANISDKSSGPTADENSGLTNLSDKFSGQTVDKFQGPATNTSISMGPVALLKKRSEERGCLADANAMYGADSLQSHSSQLKQTGDEHNTNWTIIVDTVTESQAYIDENELNVQGISSSSTSNETPHIAAFQNCDNNLLTLNSRLGFSEDIINDESSYSELNKSSLFAEEIEDSSVGIDSNTQSYLDLPDNCTDTDIDGDTDTDSVRRDFYEKTQKIKDLLEGPQNDFADVYRHKMSRNTTSSASSQG